MNSNCIQYLCLLVSLLYLGKPYGLHHSRKFRSSFVWGKWFMTLHDISIMRNAAVIPGDNMSLNSLTTFSVPKWSEMCRDVDVFTVLLLLPTHPVNSDLHTWERSLLCQELDIYMYIYIYIYKTLLIIDIDFLYHFNMGLIAPLITGSFHEMFNKKISFQKLEGLWLVGKVDNHVAIHRSQVAEGFSAFQRRCCWYSRQQVIIEDKWLHRYA